MGGPLVRPTRVSARLARRSRATLGGARLVAEAGRGGADRGAAAAVGDERVPATGRDQHPAAGAARGRAEYRGGLGRPARPRLHRVLWVRRVWLRAAVLESAL